jgi:hypothetical protein
MHGLISDLIYKFYYVQNQSLEQNTKQLSRQPNYKGQIKNKKQREICRPKIQLQKGFLSSHIISTGTTET